MDEKKSLGKGLSAIFNDFQKENETHDIVAVDLPVANIVANPKQPRKFFDEEKMEELVASIKREGVLQPILVRKILRTDAEITYQIIAGERRWRAASILKLQNIPAVVIECEDQIAIQLGLIENLQRDDLNAMEEARSMKTLIDEFHKTQEEVAIMISKSRSYVANTLRLLKLPVSVQDMVEKKQISPGHARTVLESEDPEKMAQAIVDQGLNVRDAEKMVKNNKMTSETPENPKTTGTSPAWLDDLRAKSQAWQKPEKDADILALERTLGKFFQVRTQIILKKDRPIVQISFVDYNEFDAFVQRIAGLSV